jgi:hypothetical protein
VPPLELSPTDEYYARLGISEHDVLVLSDTIEPRLDSVSLSAIRRTWC